MRGRNPESTPRFAAWFMMCTMAVILGFALNTVGACGPPASTEETAGDSGTVKPDDTTKPEEAVVSKEDPAKDDVVKEDPPKEDPPKEDPPKEDPPKDTPTPTKGSGEITGAKEATTGARAPLDASPSPDGKTIFYTAYKAAAAQTASQAKRDDNTDDTKNTDPFGQESDRQDGVLYSVPASGGTPKELATGFWSPTGLVVSKDGSKVYVADSNASDPTNPDKSGAIYSVASAGGSKSVLAGTEGYKPKSLDIVTESTDQIYFTGVDPTTDKPGVFSIAASGGTVSTVYTPGASDDFFTDPGGIAVKADRTIYVAETVGGMGGNSSSIIQIKAGKATEFATGIKVGYPAGIALSHDEKFLLVSGIDRNKSTSVVYRIDLSDATKITVIGAGTAIENKSNSAGLHRAHNADIFAWADAAFPDGSGGGGGTVFLLNTKANPAQ